MDIVFSGKAEVNPNKPLVELMEELNEHVDITDSENVETFKIVSVERSE